MPDPSETPAHGHFEALAKLRDKKSHFEELVESVEDYAIFTLDRDGIVLDWNRGAERMKGYRPDQIVGRHFSTFYTQDDCQSRLPQRELVIASNEGRFADEGWRVRNDGSFFWASVTITAIRSNDDEVVGFLKITRDLTERMQATEALRQSEERFRLVLESVQDYAIFMLDPEGHVISWNTGARRIKGYEPAEIIGKHFSTFYPPEAIALRTPESLLQKALRKGSTQNEGWRIRKDGTRFWGQVQITALYDTTGELRGFAKVTRDLTNRRELQDLQESERRKDLFLASLAHELRNPLAPMLPALELILRNPTDDATVTRVAGILTRQVEQMSFLINELLDMSRLTSGKVALKKSRGFLAEVVSSAIEAVQPAVDELNHHLEVILPSYPVEIEADTRRLSQIVTNLISNAVRYTPAGGKIVVEASMKSFPTLEISVRDNGRGIPRALHERIFDLFDQGADGSQMGLGIGLTVVKNLVEMHGGAVSVASDGDGAGSEFTVSLPILLSKIELAPAVQPPVTTADGRHSCKKILIADDGKNAADILAMFFRMEGMETSVAYDGEEAVEAAKSFQPDLILMDIGMPKMDGYEACRDIRRFLPHIGIVALSGWGGEDDRRRTSECGFDLHLVKPVTPVELREAIARLFST